MVRGGGGSHKNVIRTPLTGRVRVVDCRAHVALEQRSHNTELLQRGVFVGLHVICEHS